MRWLETRFDVRGVESEMVLKTKSLPSDILRVILDKDTEKPFVGEYNQNEAEGTYLCRQCGLALFHSKHKFHSSCGWPSFDKEVTSSVRIIPDQDGMRQEIICARCGGHLGHVFEGEGFTARNIRHCVNSVSLDFVTDKTVVDTEEAIFAGGCFWGVQYYLQQLPGVLKTEVGYIGGRVDHPTYEQVCAGYTGHYEALRVLFDPSKITYEMLAKVFFEIHDPTQTNGQGPDLGTQYQSAVFYYDEKQRQTILSLIDKLKQKGFNVVTKLLPVDVFWHAEDYHQSYYLKNNKVPYCHRRVKRFV